MWDSAAVFSSALMRRRSSVHLLDRQTSAAGRKHTPKQAAFHFRIGHVRDLPSLLPARPPRRSGNAASFRADDEALAPLGC